MTEPGSCRRSPLDAAHRALGAKMVPFGGWEMPLAYRAGTLAEHRACRTSAVAFDVSHLGTVRVVGSHAFEHLNATFTNDLGRIGPGRAQYTHLLDDADASVLDDVIVWWRPGDCFDVMPNASNTARVLAAVGGEDVTCTRAIVAVQGPAARERLSAVAPEVAGVARFGVAEFDWHGTTCVAAGTGYTGEDGVECALPVHEAASFWQALLTAGVVPAGLAARDTLRLEAGLPLHGQELGPGITPLQAGLGWVVAWDKGPFPGRAALEEERRRGPRRRLRGLVVEGRQPPRHGYAVVVEGKPVGTVTSGNFSPVLEQGIALAFLPPGVGPGAVVEVELRHRLVPAQVVKPPFVAMGATRASVHQRVS
ncbi:MAG: glycine cleavage system aminomethyltransferase GcvT [Actinomycetota bacterium]|nr:glycine cleavage system aminomethyltransferase GcvT [Actinomycetota bacterium]